MERKMEKVLRERNKPTIQQFKINKLGAIRVRRSNWLWTIVLLFRFHIARQHVSFFITDK